MLTSSCGNDAVQAYVIVMHASCTRHSLCCVLYRQRYKTMYTCIKEFTKIRMLMCHNIDLVHVLIYIVYSEIKSDRK